jgi:hypothetical protein
MEKMDAEEAKLKMIQAGLIELFKLHQEEILYGEKHIKIIILLLDMRKLFIFLEVPILLS